MGREEGSLIIIEDEDDEEDLSGLAAGELSSAGAGLNAGMVFTSFLLIFWKWCSQ